MNLTDDQKRRFLAAQQKATPVNTMTDEQKRAFLLQQQAGTQPDVKPEEPVMPIVDVDPKSVTPEIKPEKSFEFMSEEFKQKSNQELYENVKKSIAAVPFVGPAVVQVQEMSDKALAEFAGDLASIPGAMKGAELASKFAPGFLKFPAGVIGGGVGAGLAQFFGELGSDVYNGDALGYRKAFKQGADTAVWDVSGALVIGGLGKVSAKVLRTAGIKNTTDAVKAARELLQKHGADLTWYQASGGKMSAIVEGIGRVALGGDQILASAFKKAETALTKETEMLQGSMTGEALGNKIVEVTKKARESLRDVYDGQYEAIYEAGKDIPVNLVGYKKALDGQIAKRAGASSQGLKAETNDYIQEANKTLVSLVNSTNMSALNETVKQLRSLKRKAEDVGGEAATAGIGYINKEIKKLDDIMGAAAQQLDPDLKNRLDVLNASYAKQVTKIKSSTMRKLATKDAEAAAAVAYNTPKSAADFYRFLGEARKLKTIDTLEYNALVDEFRGGYLKKVLKSEGLELKNLMSLRNTLGKESEKTKLIAIIGKERTHRLTKILDTAEMVSKQAKGRLSLAVGSRQASAVQTGVATLGTFGAGATIGAGGEVSYGLLAGLLLAPAGLAKAASTAKTFGEWSMLNTGLQKAIKQGDTKKYNVFARRAVEWLNRDEQKQEPDYPSLPNI